MQIHKQNTRYLIAMLVLLLCLVTLLWVMNVPVQLITSDHDIEVDHVKRSYRMVVPETTASLLPIVFAFHGKGDTATSMADYSQLDQLAAKNNFILVYPEAIDGKWLAMESDIEGAEVNRDIQLFDAILNEVQTKRRVNPTRVYVVGMSNGAAFVQRLAHHRSDVIAAVVAHSGPCPDELVIPERLFPIMLLVGEDDFVSGTVRSDADEYNSRGHPMKYIEVQNLGHEWSTEHNQQIWKFLASHNL